MRYPAFEKATDTLAVKAEERSLGCNEVEALLQTLRKAESALFVCVDHSPFAPNYRLNKNLVLCWEPAFDTFKT